MLLCQMRSASSEVAFCHSSMEQSHTCLSSGIWQLHPISYPAQEWIGNFQTSIDTFQHLRLCHVMAFVYLQCMPSADVA